jgi:CheY-like chemotaxis protein
MHDTPAGPAVLLADDQEIDRFLGLQILGGHGFDVRTTNSGEEAIKQFQKARPAAMVIDVYMSGIDGFETCAEIRKLPGGTGVPIILVSGDYSDELRARAKACGADELLRKAEEGGAIAERLRALLVEYAGR